MPANDTEPSLTRRKSKTVPQQDLAGPYLENVNVDFMCYIRNILPGKDSTSFMFYYNGKLRLQSANDTEEVLEGNQGDGTKFVEWKFTTTFNRSDNGGKFDCTVKWKAGPHSKSGLKSKVTENTTVICKCPKHTTEPLLSNHMEIGIWKLECSVNDREMHGFISQKECNILKQNNSEIQYIDIRRSKL